MERKDLHIHTVFSDGENTPEEMVLAAIEARLDTIGFSDHSYTAFDESWCMKKKKISAYRNEIARLRDKYRDKITIMCGIEQDYYSEEPTAGYDYVIGSVHYLKIGDNYVPVDESAEILIDAAEKYFGGDMYALADVYYSTVSDVVQKTGADIIGHFDLITKFNEQTKLLDENDPRYRASWRRTADELLKTGVPFEINTGAMSRGYRTSPYPSAEIQDYILAKGGKLVLSSDSHSACALCQGFKD